MDNFTALTNGIAARLTTGYAALAAADPTLVSLPDVSVLLQDAHDIDSEIDTVIGQIGMLTLVNMPSFKNRTPLSDRVNGEITLIVEIGEAPLVWRDDPLTKPRAVDLAKMTAQLLQGLVITGFQPLRVMNGDFQRDKKRQIYSLHLETVQVFAAPGAGAGLPVAVSDGLMVLLLDDTGAFTGWKFRDQVTGDIVYFRIKDGLPDVDDQ